MKIIIAGTGEVGFHLSKLLAQESHDIVIIDTSKIALEKATKNLDVSTIRGDATSIKTLEVVMLHKVKPITTVVVDGEFGTVYKVSGVPALFPIAV